MKYVCWDIETSTRTEYKRKANPFSKENYVVASGACSARLSEPFSPSQGARTFGEYFPARGYPRDDREDERSARILACKNLPKDWFTQHLEGTKLLVGVNIKFDLLYALANPNCHPEHNLVAWMQFVENGGTVWDCQLAEYLLAGMEQSSHMLSMDEMAPAYGGDEKIDEVKALWNAGVDTIDIPEDLLMRYLLGGGDVKGDIRNTELIFRGQWERAKKSGQLRSILLNMGAMLFTIEAERNGMHVDRALGDKLQAEIAIGLAEATVELEKHLPEGLPFDFNWNSRFHKSALIFGGKVKYVAKEQVRDEAGELVYYQKTEKHYILSDGNTAECAAYDKAMEAGHTLALPVLFAGGKNKGTPKTKNVTVPDIERGPKERNANFFYEFPGFTKPNPKWESPSDPGVYSTAADVIEALGNRNIPFLKALAKVAAMTKDLGTYFWTEDPETGERKGMLTLVQLDSIIHHMLNMTSTVTARLSSSNPNLQNLSKGQKSDVKLLFTSRFGEAGCIIQSDFSSLEVYIQAILTKAKNLIADLRSGKDMHCVRLAAKTGEKYEDVLRWCKGDNEFGEEHQTKWDYMRTGAKEFSFQRAYGAGNDAIAESTGMDIEDVKALAEAEDARNPEIGEFIAHITSIIQQGRKPSFREVPHPEVPGLTCQLGKSYYTTPDGKLYCFYESPTPKFLLDKNKPGRVQFRPAGFSPTEIKNYPFQGSGGEWMKAAMWLTVRAFYRQRNFEGKALIVNTVHDASYVDAHNSVKLAAAALLHACMVEASTFMEWFFKWPLPLGVPSDTVWGPNMGTENKITDPAFHPTVERMRARLRALFIGNHTPSFL